MIALIAAAAAVAVPFAPPIDTPIRYVLVEYRPLRGGGEARFTLHQTLRFLARGPGYEAVTIAGQHSADAPEPQRSLHDALLSAFTGVATRVQLDRGGAIVAPIEPETSWAAIVASQRTLLAKIEAEPRLPDTVKQRARAITAANFEQTSPADRDARLASAVAALLPPPLPALEPGEPRALAIGAAAGTVTLAIANPDRLTYRIETHATPPDASTDLRGMSLIERTELVVDRSTGLLIHIHTDRYAQAPDGTRRNLEWDDLSREP